MFHLIPQDRNHIEPAWTGIRYPVFPAVVFCGMDDFLLFVPGDSFCRVPGGLVPAVFHLYKYQTDALFCHQINLSPSAEKIPLQDLKTVPRQPESRLLFIFRTGSTSVHVQSLP